MPITITTNPDVPGKIGPGAAIQAVTSIATPTALPWFWRFTWTKTSDHLPWFTFDIVDNTGGGARQTMLYNQDFTPSILTAYSSIAEGEQAHVSVHVTDDLGATVQPDVTADYTWSTTAFLHQDMWLMYRDLKLGIAGGSADERIDAILAAVYRTWPGA